MRPKVTQTRWIVLVTILTTLFGAKEQVAGEDVAAEVDSIVRVVGGIPESATSLSATGAIGGGGGAAAAASPAPRGEGGTGQYAALSAICMVQRSPGAGAGTAESPQRSDPEVGDDRPAPRRTAGAAGASHGGPRRFFLSGGGRWPPWMRRKPPPTCSA